MQRIVVYVVDYDYTLNLFFFLMLIIYCIHRGSIVSVWVIITARAGNINVVVPKRDFTHAFT